MAVQISIFCEMPKGAKRASSSFSIYGISRLPKYNKALYGPQSKVQPQILVLLPDYKCGLKTVYSIELYILLINPHLNIRHAQILVTHAPVQPLRQINAVQHTYSLFDIICILRVYSLRWFAVLLMDTLLSQAVIAILCIRN